MLGYGRIGLNGKTEISHRVAYAIYNKLSMCDIRGMVVRHKCDRPSCINPLHLELGSQADNIRDCVERGRHKVSSYPGVLHGKARLSEKDVLRIRGEFGGKYSRALCLKFAKLFDVSISTIDAVFYRRNWKHI